jgi:hypothetical protein
VRYSFEQSSALQLQLIQALLHGRWLV